MEAEGYRERLRHMPDDRLREEWGEPAGATYSGEGWMRQAAEHEMAMRWKNRPQLEAGSYYMDKLMGLPGQFRDACHGKRWAEAKRVYDDICRLVVFLEVPFRIRQEIFGYEEDDGTVIRGMVPKGDVARVMRECIIGNRLGFECMVYRIPGEAGYHGAEAWEGTRPMGEQENPAYHCADIQDTGGSGT